MGITFRKLPQGVIPRYLYEETIRQEIHWNGGMSMQKIQEVRLGNLKGAIARYAEEGFPIPYEWIIEYHELLLALSKPIDVTNNRAILYKETWITQDCLLN